jgi:hypothetical protein
MIITVQTTFMYDVLEEEWKTKKNSKTTSKTVQYMKYGYNNEYFLRIGMVLPESRW